MHRELIKLNSKIEQRAYIDISLKVYKWPEVHEHMCNVTDHEDQNLTPTRMSTAKMRTQKQGTARAGDDVEELGPLARPADMYNGAAAVESSLMAPRKVKNRIASGSNHCNFGYIPIRTESRVSKRYVHTTTTFIAALFATAKT